MFACLLGVQSPLACSAEPAYGNLLDKYVCAHDEAARCLPPAGHQDASWSDDSDTEATLMTTSLLQLQHTGRRVSMSPELHGQAALTVDQNVSEAVAARHIIAATISPEGKAQSEWDDREEQPGSDVRADTADAFIVVDENQQRQRHFDSVRGFKEQPASEVKADTADAFIAVDENQQRERRFDAVPKGDVQEGAYATIPISQSALGSLTPTRFAGKVIIGAMFFCLIVLSACREDNDGLDLFPAARAHKIVKALTHEPRSPAVADQDAPTLQLPTFCRGCSRAPRLAMATAAFKRASEWSTSIAGPDRMQRLGAACRLGPDGRRTLELYLIGADGEPHVIASVTTSDGQDLAARSLKMSDKDGRLLGNLDAEKGGEGFVFTSPAGIALARLGPDSEGDCLELTSAISGQRLASATPRAAMELDACHSASQHALLEEDHLDVSAELGVDAAFVLLCALAVTIFEMRSDAE